MRLAILRLEKDTKLVVKECDLGFEHRVPGFPESVWLAVEISKAEDLEAAKRRAYEKYPVELGWRVAFLTNCPHGSVLEALVEALDVKEPEMVQGGMKPPFEGEYTIVPVPHCIFLSMSHTHWQYNAGAWCRGVN